MVLAREPAGLARRRSGRSCLPVPPPPAYQQIHPLEATASSYLHSAWNAQGQNYHPRYVLDDDPSTAWQEGAPGPGEGERLTLAVETVEHVSALRLSLRAGYQKSTILWKANPAPRALRVTLLDSQGRAALVQETPLEHVQGWQDVEIPTADLTLGAVSFEIVSVFPGTRYLDASISDVRLYVVAPDATGSAAVTAAQDAQRDWFAQRRAAAEAAAARPWPVIFAAEEFRVETSSLPGANPRPAEWAAMEALRREATDHGQISYVESLRPPIRAPRIYHWRDRWDDPNTGLMVPSDLFDPGALAVTEAEHAWSAPEVWSRGNERSRSEAWVLRDEGGAIRAIYGESVEKWRSVMRSGGSGMTWIVAYQGGRVTRLLCYEKLLGYEGHRSSLFLFGRDAEGRIDQMDVVDYVSPSEKTDPPWRVYHLVAK